MDEARAEVCRLIRCAPHAERTKIIRECATVHGVSTSTIYRWLARNSSARQRRSDRGTTRTKISEDAQKKMFALTIRYGFAAGQVIAQARKEGWIDTPLHPSTYNRWLAQAGISRRKLTKPGRMDGKMARSRLKSQPHRRFEAAFPNAIHQIDMSELPRYFVAGDDCIGFESELVTGHNKAGNDLPRLHIYVMVDDFSRMSFARFRRGKTASDWARFIVDAWGDPDLGLGCPDLLYADNESALRAGIIAEILDLAHTEKQVHQVGNPAAKGKVERMIGILKSRIIPVMRVEIDAGHTFTTAHANIVLTEIVAELNARTHGSTGESPISRWKNHTFTPRPLPPAAFERAYYISTDVLLYPDLSIRIEGHHIQVPRKEPFLSHVGENITLARHHESPLSHAFILTVEGEDHRITPRTATPDRGGEWKALPKSRPERAVGAAYETDLSGFVAHQPIAPNTVPITASRRKFSRVRAKSQLAERGIEFSNSDIATAFGEKNEIDEREFDALVSRLSA